MTEPVADAGLPDRLQNDDALEELLSRPDEATVRAVARLDGDLLILGAGGKMGPTLCRMAARAVEASGVPRRVLAVSRFSNPDARAALEDQGVDTLPCDLSDEAAVAELPEAANVIYMVGRKFGSTGEEWRTWAVNAYLPGRMLRRFQRSRFVVFSTGNIYPLVPVRGAGSTEDDRPGPVGEYAQSCLGRERIAQHFSLELEIPVLLFRLNYAVELRYGVLLDVAQRVAAGQPVDVTMGHANVIWQGDANAVALRALHLADTPAVPLNVTGPETVSIRWLARRFGQLLDAEPVITGQEAETAFLSNAGRMFRHFGYPRVPLERIIYWVAHWVQRGGATLEKPTHFQERAGRY